MKPYRKYHGPHTRRRRHRRLMKAGVLVALVLLLASAASGGRPREIPPPGKWDNPSPGELATARKYYEVNGCSGDSIIYLERWPQYAAYIRGETDILEIRR